MAIAKMEKLKLTFAAELLDDVLSLMQGFQGIHVETGFESTIPPAKKAEIDKDIRNIEKNLQDIRAAYGILQSRKTNNMRSMLKENEERQLSITELTDIVEDSDWKMILEEVIQTDRRLQNNRLRRQEVTRLLDKMELWEHLCCNPLAFEKFNRATAFAGSVHKKHAEEFSENLARYEEDGICFETITELDERVYFVLLCHCSMDETLNAYMNEFSFSPEEYPFDKPQAEARRELEDEESGLLADEREIDRLIIKQSKYEEILKFAEDYNLNILLRRKKSLDITYDGGQIMINGWIVSARRKQFEKLLRGNLPSTDYNMQISQVREKDIDDVPIKLQNSRLVTVYESLTEMYSLPKYNEVDPTPVMTIFYFLFFGLMVADAGYGLAVFLVGLLVKRFVKLKRSSRGFIDFLFYLSFPMMGWGLVYGSFCGMDIKFGDMRFGLISVTVDIIPMIVISICLGYLHIMTGLVMQMINQIKLKKYFLMLTGGLAWFLTFLGGGVMILFSGIVPVLSIPAVFWAGAVLLGAGLGATIFVPAVEHGKKWYVGIFKGLYSLYGSTSYLGDFVSYTRLMALGIAGGSVALAFNKILSFMPNALKFTLGIVLAILLHALNMFLSMLSAYVHGMRLQFIEFFNKFYSGGGKKFEPFKAAEKHVIISQNASDN